VEAVVLEALGHVLLDDAVLLEGAQVHDELVCALALAAAVVGGAREEGERMRERGSVVKT